MGSLSEYQRSAGVVHSIGWRIVWCPKYIPALWSKSYFVAGVGRVSEATIRKYIGEQTTRPVRGRP